MSDLSMTTAPGAEQRRMGEMDALETSNYEVQLQE